MTSKQFLEQAVKIARHIIAARSELEMLREVAKATGAIRYDTDKVIHSVTEARFERPTIRLVDLQNEVKDDIQGYLDDHEEIRKAIAQIEDPDVRDVVRMMYLGGMEVDVIAFQLKVSKRTVWRRLERGWSDIAKITGYPAPVRNRLPAEERHGDAKRLLREYYREEET